MNKQRPVKKNENKKDDLKINSAFLPLNPAIALLILLLSVFFIFRSSFNNKFVNWDDQVYVEEQPLVLNKEYAQLLKTPVSLNYHPITMISLALQIPKDVNKNSPARFIKLNVFIHLLNTMLVFFLIYLINEKKWLIALFTAAVFALHPAHVESVVWISERKDVLYTFFLLLSCINYWIYLETEKKKWLLFAAILFILSVLSKAMAVVIPIVWLLLDFWKSRSLMVSKVWLEKVPFFAVSIFFGLMAVSVQSGGDFGGLLTLYGEKTKAVADANIFTVWQRFQFATYGFFNYIFLFFNPTKLSAFYPYPPDDKLSVMDSVIYPLAFVATTIGVIWSVRKTKVLVFGMGLYFVTIALVLQFMSVGLAIMADRYTYIPFIGLAFMISYLVDKWLTGQTQILKFGGVALAVSFTLFLAIKTKSQVEVWQDSESLWTQALKNYPKDDLALANRGNYRGKNGNISGAMSDFEIAVSDGCNRADVYEGLGNSYGTLSEQQPEKKQELVDKAISMYQKALQIDPSKGNIHYNLGVAQLQANPGASVVAFTEALKLMPYREGEILPVLGLSQLNSGNFPNAITSLTKAINLGLKTDALFYHRGLSYLGIRNREKALFDFRQALAINPTNEDVRKRLLEF